MPPQDWTLTEEEERPPAWANVLIRRTYCLLNPDDSSQALYCYAEKQRAADGKGRWVKRVGLSSPAAPLIGRLADWAGRDDQAMLVAIFAAAQKSAPNGVDQLSPDV